MKIKLHYVFFLAILFSYSLSFGQNNFWSKVSKESLNNSEKVDRASQPKEYEVFHLDLNSLKNALINAPLAESVSGRSNLVIEFPMEGGNFEKFSVSESPIMEAGLAARYPMIKTYKAIGVDDPTATMRFSVTQFGLHAMSLSGSRSSVYIDPYTEDRATYIAYDRVSLGQDTQSFECLVEENIDLSSLKMDRGSSRNDIDDRKLRTYRLAQSCNGEYAQIFAGTGTEAQQKANVQAQMAVTMNRVNEIYERDLAIRLVFVANNDEVIYLNPLTDPWGGEFNTTTAQTLDNVIGVSNYDIGHNFNTTGGGSAGCLGCVCASTSQSSFHKGRGYTGRSNPTGDAFDIDYVAHEMGHQFDGWHSMNTCSRSGNGTTEVEPASGSSIMGYAGICATNVQSNSDAHFNYVNIRDISTNIQTGVSSSCDVETSLANQPPVADAGADYSIPPSTAYVLRGAATDPDGTASLTYNWSQNDPDRAPGDGSPESTWTVGPLYRSILPTTSPDRYMPSWSDVVAGNLTPTWEVTPSVGREMNFSFIVRDNGSGLAEGIGQTDADLMVVNVQDGQPFTVVSPPAWGSGSAQTLTWNVAGTNTAPINCQTVNIKFSIDGGLTFPTTLASGVANDGSEIINVPAIADTDSARVMVEAADNIFYALSDTFSISSAPSFAMSSPVVNQSACNIDMVSYNVDFFVVNGFNETTTFSAVGNPAGSIVTFTPETLNANGQTVMEVSNLLGAAEGEYTITVTGTSTSETKTVEVVLDVVDGLCTSVGNMTDNYLTSTTGVIFNTINNLDNNPGGDVGYTDFTGLSTDVNRDSTYDLTVNMNTDGAYTCYSVAWIDWNQNCLFEANEAYDLGSAYNTANGPAGNSPLAITVPTDAVLGSTTMRVTTKWNGAATSCENNHDAEVEDYSVNVMTSLSVSEFTSDAIQVFPNPNNGAFTIKLNSNSGNAIGVVVYDIRGRKVYNNSFINHSSFNQTIELGNVQSGVYLLNITDGDRRITKKVIVE
ncbi:zinc-dependent metalloprotease family protein [Oceanihabitans sp. 2_MG-2023]|uniref:zinc-dependent metalloprotease n=1 Tax=Oceanihabitans sp. 2_MG-2023 TaxID=3062661 RepID=UPI0026E3DDAD|nr:zinc-dependent metalloprotease family protein [Oceanihabitans sp. 2_MG-2023]MDO6596501.1 zinc-dependent metalloprotease family protein [Oceanihabitans sp. 2_MG-2023]